MQTRTGAVGFAAVHVPRPGGGPSERRGRRGERFGDPGPEDSAFQQGVRRQPVRAVHARARSLADRPQARQGRAAVDVCDDAAHQVVGGGCHRDRLSRPLDPAPPQLGIDRGEALGQCGGAQCSRIEHDRLALLFAATSDGPGDDVARGELSIRMLIDQEAATSGIPMTLPIWPADRMTPAMR